MPLRNSGVLLCGLCVLSVAGCDPVRTTLQPVHLEVTGAASSQPVAGAEVSVRWHYLHDTNAPGQPFDDPQAWDELPLQSGLTDQQGHTAVAIKFTGIDRTIGPWTPSWRDWVSGRPYSIRVRTGEAVEQFRLVMQPGAFVRGRYFAMSVLAIERPRYVKTGSEP
jgi:hypothetical protein